MTAEPSTDVAQERFDRMWSNLPGWRGFFTAVQHKNVGMRYMVTAFVLFLVGGVQALLMRLQLAQPENDLLSPDAYNALFTMHGTTMMFLFAVPFLEGLGTYLLPLMIGCRDMAFPRYNAFNYWCYLFGAIILYSSYLFAMVPDAGWFAYVPLSGAEFSGRAMDFWLFGLTLAEIAAIGAAIELSVSVLRMRAPGMSLNRMPIFAWTMLAVSFLILVAFIPLLVASVLLELDRTIGTVFFDSTAGGNPLLWQHLFWIFGHPEVYVIFLPGAAIISHVVPVHSQHRLVAYPLIVVALAATAVMSLGLWVHHMYTTGLPSLTLSFFTAASMSITLASGLQVFAWIATLWLGKPRLTVPMLWSLGFIVTFVLGGITGVMVASVAFDSQVHDTYFVVAHFHYVLIGGMLFPVFAGLHHWWGKFTGKTYSERAGKIGFWLTFLGFHTTFFPMHLAGFWGMPRRVYTYEQELGIGTVNLISTVGAFVIAAGVLVTIASLAHGYRRGAAAAADPWHGDSLEWTIASPPSSANFDAIPVVASRTPAWDPPGNDEPELREAFDRRPTEFRATPTTTVVSAEPDGVTMLPGPTYWPLIAPLGLLVIATALLAQWYPVALLGVLVVLVGLGGWSWKSETEQRKHDLRPLAGKLPFEAPGPGSLGWWGAAAAGAVVLVGMATLAFSTLYLQVNAAVWPEDGPLGRPVLSSAVTLLLIAATAGTWWGARQGRGRDKRDVTSAARRGHLWGAAAAMALGLVGGLLVLILLLEPGLDPTAHAYDSAVWTMLAVHGLVIAGALGFTGVAVMARLRHSRDSRAALLLEHATLIWGAATLAWLLVWASTDLFPSLVI